MLIEQKSAGRDLKEAYHQAGEYFDALPEHDRPRFVMVSDFQIIELHALNEKTTVTFSLADFPSHVESLRFILGVQRRTFHYQDPANIKAAELVGHLHDQLMDARHQPYDPVMSRRCSRSWVAVISPPASCKLSVAKGAPVA